jgi:RNA polymerase sigma-54 factor
MKNTLNLKLQNKLNLTISLKQQLRLLTLNYLQLKEEIKNELSENPFLEEIVNIETETVGYKDLSSNVFEDEEDFSPLNKVAYKPSLIDILEFQIDLEFDEIEKKIAYEIIGNLNEKGLLSADLKEIAKKINVSVNEVEKVRKKVMKLEPTGIGALTLEEALLVQYEEKFGKDPLIEKIFKEDLMKINDKDYIKEKYSLTDEDYENIVCSIKQLVPYPTFNFQESTTYYVEPDIFIYDLGDKFEININEWEIPKLKLTTQYKKLISQKDLPEETKKFLEEKLEKAIGIIKGIEQRRENLIKIVNTLVDYQSEFLRKGIEYLKPLTLKDVAEKVGLHESTVSRITSSKYAQTPIGVIPLKAFFATKVSSTGSGEDISAEKVKSIIREIIEKEDKKKPLSDESISKILRKEYKINIARRTVAKYREEMNIPESRKRRKA